MSKGILKTASGVILKDSSPSSIEGQLIKMMHDALGSWKNAVKIRPFLEVDEADSDLSNNVKNAFGAIQLDVYGAKLYIPFIIADKTLLPFDTIRMGEQEVAYDYSKLRRLVNAIEHKAKEKEDKGFSTETMELADYNDIQHNNGFLGTIMSIRDNHRNNDARSNDDYRGPGFGDIGEERIMRYASEMDVMDGFHSVMEKIANIKPFTLEQLRTYEQHLEKEAEAECEEMMEKMAAAVQETLDTAILKRNMMKLEEEKLFNVHRASSGNNIAFPIFEDNRLEFRSGRVYRNFKSWFKNSSVPSTNKLGALILDSRGGYSMLKSNESFMASTKEPAEVELPTTSARSLETGPLYVLELNKTTVYNPFYVETAWMKDRLENRLIFRFRNNAREASHSTLSANSIIEEVFECREMLSGQYKRGVYSPKPTFTIIVSKDPDITEPLHLNKQEVEDYIGRKSQNLEEAMISNEMLFYSEDYILIPSGYPIYKAETNIQGFYTRPDGLTKEGPFAKTAAYEGQNKATLVLTNQREPKQYAVEWQYTKKDSTSKGVVSDKLEKRKVDGLSKEKAMGLLANLGFDHRTQAKFFEISDRNGRSATFRLQDVNKASKADPNSAAQSKVKQKMKGIADSMLHANNFTPLMENAIADGLSLSLATLAPSSVDAVHKVSDFFGTKEAMETAAAIEKVATELNGANWHELAALLNMKHRLDKVAMEIAQNKYLANGHQVFEKTAEFKPIIEQKASELIDFNRKQLLNTDSYLISPSLVKKALNQLDGLYKYASLKDKKKLNKKASFFRNPVKSSFKELSENINDIKQQKQLAQENLRDSDIRLRSLLTGKPSEQEIEQAMLDFNGAKQEVDTHLSTLHDLYQQSGDMEAQIAKRNLTTAAALGVPGLAGLSYLNEAQKDKRGL